MEAQQSDLQILRMHLVNIIKPIDSAAVQESTAALLEVFKNPECIKYLLELMIGDEDQSMRQISCVYLRIYLPKLWCNMDADTQAKIKTALLERFQVDPVSLIKKSIAGVIGSLCKMLIPNREWDDLFKFVMQFSQSESVADQELALLLLSVIIEYLGKDDIKEHFDNISLILMGAIKSQQASIVDFGITCINNVAKATSNVKVLK